jgi:enolase
MGRQKVTSRSASLVVLGVSAREVIDSRGNPTVEVDVRTRAALGRASVPSGASKGANEAVEVRDGDRKRFHGKGVLKAVKNVNEVIAPRVKGLKSTEQERIDRMMIELDGTRNKSRLGANAILAVSMAVARAAAAGSGRSLFRYLNSRQSYKMPVPMMNVINGGEHAGNKLAIQEFLIEPVGASRFSEAVRFGAEVYHSLKSVLEDRYGRSSINVGDEGGFAPPMKKTRDALRAVSDAVRDAGYSEGEVALGIDAASSTFYSEKNNRYAVDGEEMTAERLEDFYCELADEFGLLTIEDPFHENALDDFGRFVKRVGRSVRVIGDDLYVTDVRRIRAGIERSATNAVLIKLNQVGTVTETISAIKLSKRAGWDVVVSHRSGETEDNFISHLATAFEASFIKAGAPARGERTAKYNELLRIEEELGTRASYAGQRFG